MKVYTAHLMENDRTSTVCGAPDEPIPAWHGEGEQPRVQLCPGCHRIAMLCAQRELKDLTARVQQLEARHAREDEWRAEQLERED